MKVLVCYEQEYYLKGQPSAMKRGEIAKMIECKKPSDIEDAFQSFNELPMHIRSDNIERERANMYERRANKDVKQYIPLWVLGKRKMLWYLPENEAPRW